MDQNLKERECVAREAAMSSAVQEIDRLEAEIRDAYERVRRAKRQGIQGSELNVLVKDFEAKQRIWLEFIEKPVDKDWS